MFGAGEFRLEFVQAFAEETMQGPVLDLAASAAVVHRIAVTTFVLEHKWGTPKFYNRMLMQAQ